MELEAIKKLFDEGHKTLLATMNDGEIRNLRLFKSSGGELGYYKKGGRRNGFAVRWIVRDIASVKIVGGKKAQKTYYDRFLGNLRKFKKTYTKNVHPNLWSDLQNGYTKLDIDKFEKFINDEQNREQLDKIVSRYHTCSFDKDDAWHLGQALREFCSTENIDIIYENQYKTTTIRSNAPRFKSGHNGYSSYDTCVANIKKHMDNKEEFSYGWSSNYDVSVSGKLCDDGVYRAWFSLEFRGCGNGHYYFMVNENQAVFGEDD